MDITFQQKLRRVFSVLSIIGFVTAAIFIVIFEFIKPNYLLDKVAWFRSY
ncbi:hypothetical protein ONA24_06060 [Mycoplasmopsis cynos]|nr:hypothetical protein [Mycoplasmopsis cynos]WAM09530.1 hypothetical protein ONA24_06060 [Mycoplasmopsis cynos]